MADKQSFLSKQGLALYNAKLIKEKLSPASEFKRGTVKTTDFPCYTSDKEKKVSATLITGIQDEGSVISSLSFLSEDINGNKITSSTDLEEATFPKYTVIVDGKIFEHFEIEAGYTGSSDAELVFFDLYNENDLYIRYDTTPSYEFRLYSEDSGVSHHVEIYKEGVEIVHKLDKKYVPALGLTDLDGALDITSSELNLGGMTMASDGSVTESHSDYTGATFTESTDNYTIEAFEWNLGIGLHELEDKTIKVVYDGVTYQANPIEIQDDGNVVYYLFGALSSEEIAQETDEEFLRKYEERGFASYPFKMHLCIIIRTDSQTQVQTPVFAIWEGYLSESAHTLELSMIEKSEKIKSKYLPETNASVDSISDSEIALIMNSPKVQSNNLSINNDGSYEGSVLLYDAKGIDENYKLYLRKFAGDDNIYWILGNHDGLDNLYSDNVSESDFKEAVENGASLPSELISVTPLEDNFSGSSGESYTLKINCSSSPTGPFCIFVTGTV